ncbi:MAG: TonB-dependent receptor plug domain-containing protein, partial [Pseudomonadota bacterium]
MDHRLLTKASAFAVAAAVAASPALAQNDVSTLTDTIVITATKKLNAENVQDVPLAVTGYGEDQLNALKVRDLQDLTYSIPNVQLDDVGTIPGVANFAIRGLGVNSSIPSIDPTVGVFVDGMFLGINAGVVLDQFDIESIEILRGPQGILFGRNVTGGAVVVNTKDAPDEFEGQIRGGVDSGLRGTGNNYYIMGSVGGPIIEDKLNLKVAAYLNDDEGWFENLNNPGENFGERQTFLFRPSILVRPTDNIELNVKYEYGQNRGDGPAAQNHVNNAPGSGMGGPGFDRNTFDFAIDVEGFVDQRWDQVTAELNWDVGFGDGRITNVFSYRDYEASSQSDIDASPVAGFESRAQIDQDQISNELRYAGRFFDRMDLTAGVFFFTQDIG